MMILTVHFKSHMPILIIGLIFVYNSFLRPRGINDSCLSIYCDFHGYHSSYIGKRSFPLHISICSYVQMCCYFRFECKKRVRKRDSELARLNHMMNRTAASVKFALLHKLQLLSFPVGIYVVRLSCHFELTIFFIQFLF